MSPTTAKFLADALVVGHLAFVAFALFGAVLALRWRRLAVLHLPAVAWVIYVAATNRICPLTPMENDLRVQAGEAGYEGGFVDHYLVPVLYPDGLTPEIQRRMGGGILLFNLACYAGVVVRWRSARRRRRDASASTPAASPVVPGPAVPPSPTLSSPSSDAASADLRPVTVSAPVDCQVVAPATR